MPLRCAILIVALFAATPALAQPERELPADTTLPTALLERFRADAAAVPDEASFLDLDSVAVPVLVYDRRDLNADGRDEVFLSGLGRYCGASGNCPLWIYTPADGGWRRIHAGGGLGVEVLQTRTNGFPDLMTPSHFSAFETYLSSAAFDGERYVWSGTALLAATRDDTDEEAETQTVFEVRSPVPARTDPATPRTVNLLPMLVDSARGITLAAGYTSCTANLTCPLPRLVLRAPAEFAQRCVTLWIESGNGDFAQAGAPVCGTEEGGATVYHPSAGQWEAMDGAAVLELRSGSRTLSLGEYAREGLSAFAAGMYNVDGRELPLHE